MAGFTPEESCFDTPSVPVLVAEDGEVGIAVAHELTVQQGRLVSSELEQERAATPEKARSIAQDASQDVGAVGAAIVGERRFEREGVPLEQGNSAVGT